MELILIIIVVVLLFGGRRILGTPARPLVGGGSSARAASTRAPRMPLMIATDVSPLAMSSADRIRLASATLTPREIRKRRGRRVGGRDGL